MKTPREILLAGHSATVPKLDAIRHSTVAAVCDRRPSAEPKLDAIRHSTVAAVCDRRTSASANETHERRSPATAIVWQRLWQELVWPCRRIWTGLAAVWIVLFLFNLSQRDGSPTVIAKSSPPAATMMTLRDQQKLLNELFADRSLPADAEPTRTFSPKPRTEFMEFLMA